MLELQKIFLLVGFFNWISCNKSLKAKISHFFTCFFCLNPRGWNVLEAERLLCSWRHIGHIGWRNTKICIHRASWMEQKCVKCWKSPIFEGKLWVFISYLSEMKIVSMFYNPSLFTFYSLFLSFFEIQVWQGFHQTFCFHIQIRMIWTAMDCNGVLCFQQNFEKNPGIYLWSLGIFTFLWVLAPL